MDRHFNDYLRGVVAAGRDRNAARAEELAAAASAGELDPDELVELAAELRELADSLAPAGVRVITVSERASSDYFGWNGDPDSGGWGTVEDPATGGSWTKIV